MRSNWEKYKSMPKSMLSNELGYLKNDLYRAKIALKVADNPATALKAQTEVDEIEKNMNRIYYLLKN